MTLFLSAGEIYHTAGSRLVWSTTRRPMLLLPNKVMVSGLSISWPHPATANAYGYAKSGDFFGTEYAASFITVVPQEWDSGLTAIATIPAGCNYFRVEVSLDRVSAPGAWLGGATIPMLLRPNSLQVLDGAGAVAERIGPLVRIFRFERIDNTIYLRRKQSVQNAGARFPWLSGNDPTNGAGGQRSGWTWGGSSGELGHAAALRAVVSGTSNRNRNQSGMAPVDDNTNFASTWSGTVIFTPGYIKA